MKDYVNYVFTGSHHTWYVGILIPWICEKFGIKPGSKVIDVGCGNGDCVDVFNRCKMQAVGVDRHREPGKKTVVCDIEKRIPFKANTFDAAFNKSVIEHVRDQAAVADEVCRVLKPGGKFIILSPDWAFCYKSFYSDPTHYTPACHDGLAQLLDLHGFHQTTKELIRPEASWIRHPKWRKLYEIAIAPIPYKWMGEHRFAKKAHTMSLVCGVKE